MSARQQRRELAACAKQLRKTADDLQTLGAPGPIGLRGPDKVAAAEAIIAEGAT